MKKERPWRRIFKEPLTPAQNAQRYRDRKRGLLPPVERNRKDWVRTVPEYRSWTMMKNRCLNPKAQDYAYYGGRGIRVADAWLTFEGFLNSMGRKPTPLHTLERIDTEGHYCEENCEWATRQRQARNRPAYNRFDMQTAEQVRELYRTGNYYQYEIAEMFGATQAHISQIVRGVVWK